MTDTQQTQKESKLIRVIDVETGLTETVSTASNFPLEIVYRDKKSRGLDQNVEESKYSLGFRDSYDEATIGPFVNLSHILGFCFGVSEDQLPKSRQELMLKNICEGRLRAIRYRDKRIIFPDKLQD